MRTGARARRAALRAAERHRGAARAGNSDAGLRPRQTSAGNRGADATLRPRVLRPDRRGRPGCDRFPGRRPRRGARQAAVRRVPAVPLGAKRPVPQGPVIGFDLPGCFAERARCPRSRSSRWTTASPTARPRACSRSATASRRSRRPSCAVADTVVIFGQGSMGLECLQIARLSGAGLVITVDVRDESCRVSRELGADHALNARDCDVVRDDPRPDRRQRRRRRLRVRRRQPEAGARGESDAAAGDRRGPLRRQDHRRVLVRRRRWN